MSVSEAKQLKVIDTENTRLKETAREISSYGAWAPYQLGKAVAHALTCRTVRPKVRRGKMIVSKYK